MHPITLAIENSNPTSNYVDGDGPSVALGVAGTPLLGVELLRPAGRHDDDLMPAIDRLTRRIGVSPRQIGRIAVSTGPGGYTALRIAIATAKMIAEVTGAEVVPVPTAAIAAHLVRAPAAGRFAVALASKGDSAFVTVFAPDRKPLGSGQVARAADLISLATGDTPLKTLIADQFIPKEFVEAMRNVGIDLQALRLTAAACLEVAFGLPAAEAGALAPHYAREPEAVSLWRLRKS